MFLIFEPKINEPFWRENSNIGKISKYTKLNKYHSDKVPKWDIINSFQTLWNCWHKQIKRLPKSICVSVTFLACMVTSNHPHFMPAISCRTISCRPISCPSQFMPDCAISCQSHFMPVPFHALVSHFMPVPFHAGPISCHAISCPSQFRPHIDNSCLTHFMPVPFHALLISPKKKHFIIKSIFS